jgi:hypothetical protein
MGKHWLKTHLVTIYLFYHSQQIGRLDSRWPHNLCEWCGHREMHSWVDRPPQNALVPRLPPCQQWLVGFRMLRWTGQGLGSLCKCLYLKTLKCLLYSYLCFAQTGWEWGLVLGRTNRYRLNCISPFVRLSPSRSHTQWNPFLGLEQKISFHEDCYQTWERESQVLIYNYSCW